MKTNQYNGMSAKGLVHAAQVMNINTPKGQDNNMYKPWKSTLQQWVVPFR